MLFNVCFVEIGGELCNSIEFARQKHSRTKLTPTMAPGCVETRTSDDVPPLRR